MLPDSLGLPEELRIKQVAEFLDLPYYTVRYMVRSGAIPCVMRGRQRKVRLSVLQQEFPDSWKRYVSQKLAEE